MQGRKIRLWMLAHGVRVKDLARELKVTHSAVCHFLTGRTVSERMYHYMIGKGCPKVFFGDRYNNKEAA